MKKLISIILILTFLLSFLPVITNAEETPYTTIFSWNFTTGKKYTTTMVSGACATAVSWGDYRSGFMVFPIPESLDYDEWVLSDSSMVFNNGRQSGQAPNVTIRLLDGDELYDIYNKHNQGTYTDSTATSMLSALCKSAHSIGSFDTLSSNISSRLYIGDAMKTARSEGKSYIGFHLTCREEDGALNAGIVNFVKPTLSVAPEIEEVINLDITISPQTLKEAETVTLAPIITPDKASITSINSNNPSIVSASFKDNYITLTGNKQGFATVTVTISYEDNTMSKSFSVSVISSETYEAPASVTIFDPNSFSPIIMDEGYSDKRSYNQIKRAANDLRHDTALLTGVLSANDIPMDDDTDKKLERLSETAIPEIASSANAENAIIIGSIEGSEIIQSLILSGKLTKASSIKGNWEGFVIEKVKTPLPGVENAIVIAGSDTRGTIYGIYHLSEMMGVSPWYWWSDVSVDTKSSFTFFEDVVDEGPDVQYRGIFINDEEHFVEWCEHHFPTDKAMDGTNVNGPNKYIYNHMFELLLRLGANTLWPAMHEYTTAFNYDLDTDSIPFNAKAAAEYGIVMSSSHCEIMLRNNVGEWEHWYNQNKSQYNIQGSNYSNAYDYTLNKTAILAYWKERLISNKDFESIFVLGIRGVHDGAPKYANLSGAGYGSGNDGIVNMMKNVITEQRKMIKEIYGSEEAVPQVFIPYKEMNTYYNHNNGDLAAWLPDDIIVMYAEDNQNYLRQTSTAAERARKGGLGIYYHNSYWGVPKSYLWLNSTSTTLMYEEMKKAYDTGAEKYWILNVGDLKPGELNMDFFMRMAWDVEKFDDTTIYSDFYKQQAMRDYNLSEDAAEIYAEAVREINSLILTKKAEFFGYSVTQSTTVPAFPSANAFPFSVTENGDEGQILVDRWNSVVDTLSSVYTSLDEEYKNSFYEQIYHFALSYRNRNEEYVYYWKNNLYAQQGRYASTKAYADLSRKAVSRIKSDQAYYGSLNDGKWSKILNYDHVIGYQPDQGALLVNDSKYTTASPSNGVGAVCEGQSLPTDNVTLTFNSLADNSRFIDVFGKNIFEEGYVIECDDFITLSKTSGNVYTEDRIIVSIDWEKLSDGVTDGKITVFNADTNGNKTDEVNSFNVKATKSNVILEENSYSEANGFVVIEAEHYTENIPAMDGSYWAVVENLGQSGDCVKGFPDLALKGNIYNPSSTAQLVYRIYFETEGTFTGTLHRLPTLNEGSENNEARSCQVAIGLKDETPTILSGNRNTSGSWGANVMRGYEPLTFSITIPEKGYYDLVVYKVDASIAFDRIVIETTASDSSHIGPNESPNSIVSAKETVIGSTPEYLKTITPTASIAPLGNLTVGVGTVNTIAIDASGDATITFETTDPSIAQVEYNSPTLTIYGLRPGTTDIVATVSKPDADNTQETFPLFVTNEALEGYKEVNGELVINAADALSNTDHAFITNASSHSWSALGNAITVLPNKGTNWLNSSAIASAPYLSFVAEFTTAGTYYVSANLSNPDDASDSFHFGLNGSLVFSSNTKNNRAVIKNEEWFSHSSWTVTIPSAGKYTLNIWPREDGLVINQLYLSKNSRMTDGSTGNLKATGGENENLMQMELSDAEKLELDIRFMDFGCDLANVYSDITVPTLGAFSSHISWSSSDEKVLSVSGKVNIPQSDTPVTLTAILTNGTKTQTVTFTAIVKAALVGSFENILIDESFTSGDDFGFNTGATVSDGQLTLTKNMANYTTSVKTFDANIINQSAITLTFDWKSNISASGKKSGIEFRDMYGRLIFALACKNGNVLRHSVNGSDSDSSSCQYSSEPIWSETAMDSSKTYTVYLNADFDKKTVSYAIMEKDSSTVICNVVNVPIKATDLTKMIACNYYTVEGGTNFNGTQSIDNFYLTGKEGDVLLPLLNKTIYCFGDSIVDGHKYSKAGFVQFTAIQNGMTVSYDGAKNGAQITNGDILAQVNKAPEECPSVIIFTGGINDAYSSTDMSKFETAFDTLLSTMRSKWENVEIFYVAVHQTPARDSLCQANMTAIAKNICIKYDVHVADVYSSEFDTTNDDMRFEYIFDDLGSDALPGTFETVSQDKFSSSYPTGTHPNFRGIETFYVPILTKSLLDVYSIGAEVFLSDGNLTVTVKDCDTPCIAGFFNGNTLLEAHSFTQSISLPYTDSITQVKVYRWNKESLSPSSVCESFYPCTV